MQEQATNGIGAWYRRHRWLLDPALIALLSVLFSAFGFHGLWAPLSLFAPPLSPWWALVLALPACALLPLKSRLPMAVLAIASVLFLIDLLTFGGIGTLLVLLDALWTAVFLAGPRMRRVLQSLLFAGVVASFVATLVIAKGTLPIAFFIAVQFGAIFGTDYWWAVAVAQANELADLHRDRAEALAHESERDRAEAVRREREMMARELHDAVAGHVMAMAIRAEAALSTPPDEHSDRAALQAVRDVGLDAHTALRTMITVLRSRDGELIPPPRIDDLDGIIDDARRAGLAVTLLHASTTLPAVHGQTVVRVVREALANSIRHSAGARVEIEITADNDIVAVRVQSWGGRASAHAPGNGWGLSMLEERVRALDGAFTAGPVDGGWSVAAELPIGARV